MSLMWWSWILTVVGVTGFILAGKKIWWAWYINIFCQGLWFTYAIVSEQYGFIAASLLYVGVFSKNALEWTQEHRLEKSACERFHPGESCVLGKNHPVTTHATNDDRW